MDSRKNWILVGSSSSVSNAPICVGGRSFPATHSREESRLENMNRLNERIHRRLAEQDAGDGVRVVEENFRFIDDEPSERLDSLIQQRDSRGEVEAVFERRRERRLEPRMWPAIEEVPEPAEGEELEEEEDHYKNSTALYMEPPPRYEEHRYRRRESFDSTATRVVRPEPIHRPPYISSEERRPTTLRRTPLFYDKCDICAYKIMRTGDYCPACGRTASPLRLPSRSPRVRPYNEMLLSAPKLVYEPWANRAYSGYNMGGRRQYHRPRSVATSRRRVQRPVFRYGSSLPEALYDYEVWAKKKDRRRLRRKAAALAFGLLALALVISAGVVLAAIRY